MSEYYVSTDYGPMRAFNPKQFRSKLNELQTEVDSLASLMGGDTTDNITNMLSWFKDLPENTSAATLYTKIDGMSSHLETIEDYLSQVRNESDANKCIYNGIYPYVTTNIPTEQQGLIQVTASKNKDSNGYYYATQCFYPSDDYSIWTRLIFYKNDDNIEMKSWRCANEIPMKTFLTHYISVDGGNDLSRSDIYGKQLYTQTTANCYVISKPGYYFFPLVYGNAITNNIINRPAYTNLGTNECMMDFVNAYGNSITSPYIETDTGKTCADLQLSIADADIFKDLGIYKGTGFFTIKEVPATGANGVISAIDSDGNIMWSWHIWVFPYDLTPVTITNATGINYDIMPVYLATTYDDGDSTKRKNWFYQWGRPVPIVGPAAYDSETNSAPPTTYGKLSYCSHAMCGSYQQGILNPTTMYLNAEEFDFWFPTDNPVYNLWDANCSATGCSDNTTVKTVYDPSPVGFKVPNGNTFTGFSTSNIIGSFSNGYTFKKNSSDTTGIFFPASGYRILEGNYISSNSLVQTSASASEYSATLLKLYTYKVEATGGDKRYKACSICCTADS